MTAIQVIGGFGSAGSGNRTGRSTASAVGKGTTAKERERRATHVPPARGEDPTREELLDWIARLECWWCKRGPFRSLSTHWSKAHGMRTQDIREQFVLSRNIPLNSEETRERNKERGFAIYPKVAEKMAAARAEVTTHHLSSYGKQVASERLKRVRSNPEFLRRGQERQRELTAARHREQVAARVQVCVICGAEFTREDLRRRRTCSPACAREIRARNGKKSLPHPVKNVHNCVVCEKEIRGGKSLTCSETCRHENRSRMAKARTDHLRLLHTLGHEAQSRRAAERGCKVGGCTRPHHVHGLCSLHSQRVDSAIKSGRACKLWE